MGLLPLFIQVSTIGYEIIFLINMDMLNSSLSTAVKMHMFHVVSETVDCWMVYPLILFTVSYNAVMDYFMTV